MLRMPGYRTYELDFGDLEHNTKWLREGERHVRIRKESRKKRERTSRET